MKRLIIILTIVLMALTLCGCDDEHHPIVRIFPTIWTFDGIIIPVGNEYEYKPTNPYDVIETEEGIDVVIHFKEKQE